MKIDSHSIYCLDHNYQPLKTEYYQRLLLRSVTRLGPLIFVTPIYLDKSTSSNSCAFGQRISFPELLVKWNGVHVLKGLVTSPNSKVIVTDGKSPMIINDK